MTSSVLETLIITVLVILVAIVGFQELSSYLSEALVKAATR